MRKTTRTRGPFPREETALKLLYLAITRGQVIRLSLETVQIVRVLPEAYTVNSIVNE